MATLRAARIYQRLRYGTAISGQTGTAYFTIAAAGKYRLTIKPTGKALTAL